MLIKIKVETHCPCHGSINLGNSLKELTSVYVDNLPIFPGLDVTPSCAGKSTWSTRLCFCDDAPLLVGGNISDGQRVLNAEGGHPHLTIRPGGQPCVVTLSAVRDWKYCRQPVN